MATVLLGIVGIGPAQAYRKPITDWSFPDPAVAAYRHGLLAISTGLLAPRAIATSPTGPWKRTGPALVRRPGWASSKGIWAADVVHVRHHWLLYFAASVRGLGAGGRCIGVALSRSALGGFRPVGRPLVCPRGARTAPAPDPARPAHGRLPHRGVIDPSLLGMGKRLYLVYKTQGLPSTIRIVLLHDGGLRAGRHSHELIRSRHIVENPVILRRGRHRYVLVTSEGSYDGCGYTTVWRRSHHLFRWSGARPQALLRERNTGVCGPGGADLVRRRHGQLVFFHGWSCGSHHRACKFAGRRAHRTMYAVNLVWHAGRPRLRPVHVRAGRLRAPHAHRHHHRARYALSGEILRATT